MKKTIIKVACSLCCLGLLAVTVSAAPQVSAQSIIVNPLPTKLLVDVWVDRDGSGYRPTYNIGDQITLYTSVNEDAYVYLFDIDAADVVTQIYPNQYTGDQMYMMAGNTYAFPGSDDQFTFDVGGPYGVNRVLAIASRQPLNLDQLNYSAYSEILPRIHCRTPQDFGDILGMIVSPLNQQDWTSDIAYFNVR